MHNLLNSGSTCYIHTPLRAYTTCTTSQYEHLLHNKLSTISIYAVTTHCIYKHTSYYILYTLLNSGTVDDKSILHISVNSTIVGFIHITSVDQFYITYYIMLTTEIEHFLSLADTCTQGVNGIVYILVYVNKCLGCILIYGVYQYLCSVQRLGIV